MGIRPDQVEILGRFGPPEKSLGGMRVWPYVVRTVSSPRTAHKDTPAYALTLLTGLRSSN